MLCEQPIDEWRAIDVIEINGATTTFKAGDKPVLRRMFRRAPTPFLSVSSGRAADGSEVNSQKFWDQNITNHIRCL